MIEPTRTPPPNRAALVPLREAKTIGAALQSAELLDRIKQSVPQHMSPTRMLRTFVQAVSHTPALAKADLRSLLGAMLSCSQLGLEPNTPQGHAYLIPFDKRGYDKETRKWVVVRTDVQLILGYKGLLDLAFRSGQVASIHCDVVMPSDHEKPGMWSYSYGSDGHLHHRPAGIDSAGTTPTHAYMHAKLKMGEAYEVLPWSSVLSIRNASQGYKAALMALERAKKDGYPPPASYTEAPWVKYELAMGRKTAMRAGAKWMPSSIELAAAVSLDEAQDRRSLDFGMVYDGTATVLEGLPEQPDDDPDADNGGAFSQRTTADDEAQGKAEAEAKAAREKAAADAAKAERDRRFAEQVGAKQATGAAQASTENPAPTPPAADAKPATDAALPEFSAFLAGADGEVIEDVGDAGYFTDPVAFARAYATLRAATDPTGFQAIAEHNADGLDDAMQHPAAMAILTAQPAARPGRVQVTVPNKPDGAPDLKGYLATLRKHAAEQTAATIDQWEAMQRAIVDTLPAVTKRNAQKVIADRRSALGSDKPRTEPAQAATPPDEAPPPDDETAPDVAPLPGETSAPAWGRDAQGVVDELMKCTKADEITVLSKNVAIKATFAKVAAADPDEGARLKQFAEDRYQLLAKGG